MRVGVRYALAFTLAAIAIADRRRGGTWFKPYLAVIAFTLGPLLALPLVIDSPPWLAVLRPLGYPG